MPFIIGSGSGKGGASLSVRNDNFFNTIIERNDFFQTNPSRLVDRVTAVVNGTLWQYIGGAWKDMTPVVKGQTGNDAPTVKFQYSANGETGWSDTLNNNLHKFWRWSNDGGVTWTPTAPDKARYTASADGGGVPTPYEFQLGSNGKLQTYKGTKLIQEIDEYGAYIINAITTGTGSLHFGDLHSIGSANENVIFKNEVSNLAWHPSWGAISMDGATIIPQSARKHNAGVSIAYPAGSIGTATVDYNSTFTSTGNNVFLGLEIFPKEIYKGRLILRVARQLNDIEVSKFEFDVDIVNTTDKLVVPFKYPLWMLDGQQFTTTIKKENGSFLKALAGANNTAPYRSATYMTFADYEILHAGNGALAAKTIEALTGSDRLDASKLRNFPVASGTQFGTIKLGSTLSINGDGVVEVGVSPTSIRIVANQAARLAIAQSTGTTLCIQQDSGDTYGIEANQDPSINTNWKKIGTVATDVSSFNGRIGTVVPATGDYKQDQIETIHDNTGQVGYFGIDNTGIYWTVR